MIRILKKYKIVITIIVLIILIIGSIMIRIRLHEEEDVEIVEDIKEDNLVKEEDNKEIEDVSNVYVDIKGAIKNPGVYEIEKDKRVIDVINKAGGLSDNANTSFVNLAKKVEDSMVVIIYTEEEIEKAKKDEITYVIDNKCVCPKINNDACLDKNIKKEDNTKKEEESDNNTISDKININTASLLDLQTLPGIGESKAKAIIEYRDNEGSFSSIEDIKNVSGIGDSLYEKIKEYITV